MRYFRSLKAMYYGVILEGTADMLGFVIVIRRGGRSQYTSSNLALWPTSDFDPQGIQKIYNIKTLCNYEIINISCFIKKIMFLILLQCGTILLFL